MNLINKVYPVYNTSRITNGIHRVLSATNDVFADVWAQYFWDNNRPIFLLKVLNDVLQNARHRKCGVVERVRVAELAFRVLVADVESARLEVMEVRRGADFAVGIQRSRNIYNRNCHFLISKKRERSRTALAPFLRLTAKTLKTDRQNFRVGCRRSAIGKGDGPSAIGRAESILGRGIRYENRFDDV